MSFFFLYEYFRSTQWQRNNHFSVAIVRNKITSCKPHNPSKYNCENSKDDKTKQSFMTCQGFQGQIAKLKKIEKSQGKHQPTPHILVHKGEKCPFVNAPSHIFLLGNVTTVFILWAHAENYDRTITKYKNYWW